MKIWAIVFLHFFVASFDNLVEASVGQNYNWTEKYYATLIDHFSFVDNRTYRMRYLFNDLYWSGGNPIFFYTGNEFEIELFANSAGLVWELAREYGAMIIFAEHRYYGKSLPFGKLSFQGPSKFGYLTSEQALADFIELIHHVKKSVNGASKSPVIAFGGSYGGMLAAWIRMKYPNVVAGAIAASAPVLQFSGVTPCSAFYERLTEAFRKSAGNRCVATIRNLWKRINYFGFSKVGRKKLAEILKLCFPLRSPKHVMKSLILPVIDVIAEIAMFNYPYDACFFRQLPRFPVKEFCKRLLNSTTSTEWSNIDYVEGLANAMQIIYNVTGKSNCLKFSKTVSKGWDIQACNEMVMPLCCNGVSDMFLPMEWNLTLRKNFCKSTYGMSYRPYWIEKQFWGKEFWKYASNIVFSNGLLDPWISGGVHYSGNSRIALINITDGAHHLDLRASNFFDPISVTMARKKEMSLINSWIKEYARNY